jgi:hypothetical protein
MGYLGGGEFARDSNSSSSFDAWSTFSSISTPTDGPSLASCVPDNVVTGSLNSARNYDISLAVSTVTKGVHRVRIRGV